MTAPKTLSGELGALLSGLSSQGNKHLSEAETDLDQTTVLLSEAIAKLGASFMEIHRTIATHRNLILNLQGQAGLAPDTFAELEALHSKIQSNINEAITALQFQDMTSQLIGRVAQHISQLRDVLEGAGHSCALLTPASPDGEAIDAIGRVNEMLEEKVLASERTLRKSVAQTHMASGDIELF